MNLFSSHTSISQHFIFLSYIEIVSFGTEFNFKTLEFIVKWHFHPLQCLSLSLNNDPKLKDFVSISPCRFHPFFFWHHFFS